MQSKILNTFFILCLVSSFFNFLFIPKAQAAGNIYYVDSSIADTHVGSATPDCTNYDPAAFTCSGGSASAFKTIADINAGSFSPDDQILFRKGQTWREQLTVPSSGTSGHPIIFGSFGSGALPIILGSETANTTGNWTRDPSLVTDWTSGFEANNFSEWTSKTDPSGYLTPSTNQAKTGTYSARWNLVGSGAVFLRKNLSSQVPNATFQTSVFAHAVATGEDDDLSVQNSNIDGAFDLRWGKTGSALSVQLRAYDDTGTMHSTAVYAIGSNDAWHTIKVVIITATGTGGSESLYIDGVLKETVSGFDNSDRGNIFRIQPAFFYSGTDIYMDDFSVTHDSGITTNWYTGESSQPNIVWRDGARMTLVGSKGSLASDGQWWWDSSNSRVYVYAAANPANTHAFEIPQRNSCITATDKSFVTIDSVTCKYSNQSLIYPIRSAGNSTNWTIQNTTLSGTYRSAIEAVGSGANQYDHTTVNANTISDFGGDTSHGWDGVRVGYGDFATIANNTVTMSDFANNGWAGAIHYLHSTSADTNSTINKNSITGVEKTNSSSGIFLEDISYTDIFENSITANVGNSLWMDESGSATGDGPDHNSVYRNLIQMTGDYNGVGMDIENSPNNSFFSNVIVGTEAATSFNKGIWIRSGTGGNSNNTNIYNNSIIVPIGGNALQIGWSSDPVSTLSATVENNIFYKASGVNLVVVDDASGRRTNEHSHVFNNNLWWNGASNQVVDWFNTFYGTQAAFKTGTTGTGANQITAGQEMTGLEADPVFTNISTPDLTLQSTSPAIDAGLNLGSTYQLALAPASSWPSSVSTLNQNTNGSGWEMGAYVYTQSTVPSVSITSPSDGATVTGPVAVTGSTSATPPATITSVNFYLDASLLGASSSTSSPSYSWDTTAASNGVHTLTAVATDSYGSTATSSSVSITINNAVIPSGGNGGGGGSCCYVTPAPTLAATSTSTPNSSLVFPASSPLHLVNDKGTFYLVQNGTRQGVTNPGILFSYGFEFKDATLATPDELALPRGSLLLPGNGSLVKSKEDPTVYLISQGQRYGFVSAKVFSDLGFKFTSVLVVTNPELQALVKADNLSNSSLAHLDGIDVSYQGTVYWISSGVRYPYPSLAVYNSWHMDGDFSRVVTANAADIALPVGGMLGLRIIQ